MQNKTKKMTVDAMLCALCYITVLIIRIPFFEFLSYEPKDVVIAIGGFLLGPASAIIISLVVSLVEMITISQTGFIGFVMNFLSSAAFAGIAAIIYKKKHTLTGAVMGLISGILLMTVMMLLWNYLITPLYMNASRSDVAKMLVPVFLPFNLIKGTLNATITVLIYKPISTVFKKTNLVESADKSRLGVNVAVTATATVILATCIVAVLVIKGVF